MYVVFSKKLCTLYKNCDILQKRQGKIDSSFSRIGGVIVMDYPENKVKYNLEYAKKNLKRIPLDVQKEK